MPTPPTPSPAIPPSSKPKQRNRSGPRTKNGSYRHYYTRRHDGLQPDDRLPLLRQVCKSHPTSFTLLDIGCNDGTLTTELASLASCTRAVGLDINPNLIGDARRKLRSLVENRSRATAALQGPVPTVCDSLPLNVRQAVQLGKEPRIRKGVMDNCLLETLSGEKSFPANVMFRAEDFARPEETRTTREVAEYDVVLCLSVTKWVHFAWGDKGLQRMFRRIYECLKPGGVLILEPQPMKSYKSAIRKGLAKKDFKGERKLRPHEFADYLQDLIGFRDMKVLRKTRERGHAFNRPIMAFLKGSSSRLSLDSDFPHHAVDEDAFEPGLDLVNNVHQHATPLAPGMDLVAPGNGALADPVPPNEEPVDPALEAPANPIPAAQANLVPANPAPANAAPSVENLAANGEEEAVQNERTEIDSGKEGVRTGSAIATHEEDAVQRSQQLVNPGALASPVNETAGEANGAASDGDVVPGASGRKRRRSEEGSQESDERSAKIVKHENGTAKR